VTSPPHLGVTRQGAQAAAGQIAHVFHLAAVYDLEADSTHQRIVNIEGTRTPSSSPQTVDAGCFHHVSSIAAAGRYPGRFTEDMFSEAVGLEHPYFRTKHLSEKVVREESDVPWRVYRPGIVVGHSETGEMDKIDGPYHFFPALKRLAALPKQLPLIGVEGGRAYIVPVDFVADAIDHIAHVPGRDGQTFHLVESDPPRVGRGERLRCARPGRPPPGPLDARAASSSPVPLRTVIGALPPLHRRSTPCCTGSASRRSR
jgi:thioester reductase-like protein